MSTQSQDQTQSGRSPASVPASVPAPAQPAGEKALSPAFVPAPSQQGPAGEKAPWQTDEFKAKIAAAGFPGSPQTDEAWLIALYKFSGGTMPQPQPEPAQQPQNPS
jgi:hypothetical protein